jgi:PAS domain S-box-containing protein
MTWNTGAERIKGYRADEIMGQSFVRFYVPRRCNRRPAEPVLRRAIEEASPGPRGLRVRKDGSRFWASVCTDSAAR